MSQVAPNPHPLPTPGALPPAPEPPSPKRLTTWQSIVQFFDGVFHPEKKQFTEEMRQKIRKAQTDPHTAFKPDEDVQTKAEEKQFKEAILEFIGSRLKNADHEKQVARFQSLVNKTSEEISRKQREYQSLRKEHLPEIYTQFLLSTEVESDEQRDFYISMCPYLVDGKLELDPKRAEDKAIIQLFKKSTWGMSWPFSETPTVTIKELIEHVDIDRKQLALYLVGKFRSQTEKNSTRIDAFLSTLGRPEIPASTKQGFTSNLMEITTLLVPSLVDAFLNKIRSSGDFSPLFDKGIELLKEQLVANEAANEKMEEVRHTIDELKTILLSPHPRFDALTEALVENIWGREAKLLQANAGETAEAFMQRKADFLALDIAKKREEFYVKESRYHDLKFEGEFVAQAALQTADNLNWARRLIRYESKRSDYRAENEIALAGLRLLLTNNSLLSEEAKSAAQMIWGTDIIDKPLEERIAFLKSDSSIEIENRFLSEPPVHFLQQSVAQINLSSPSKEGK